MSPMTFSMAMKAPWISTYITRHNCFLRIALSIRFTRVDRAVSVPLIQSPVDSQQLTVNSQQFDSQQSTVNS